MEEAGYKGFKLVSRRDMLNSSHLYLAAAVERCC